MAAFLILILGLGGAAGAAGATGGTEATGATGAAPAHADQAPAPAMAAPAPVTAHYYVALGGSGSVGWQPTTARPDGQPTDTGYANDLLTIERARWHDLQLVQFGCPGETTGKFLNGGDRCRPAGQTQLAEADAFLRTHPTTVLVTIDLGFNDIDRCLAFHVIDETCLTQSLGLIRQQLPLAIANLRAAGGPTVRLVGIGHFDPYLGTYLHGGSDLAFSEASVAVIDRLNATLGDIYADAGVPMADVARAFEVDHSEPVDLAGVGDVPRNVERTCALTWMCTSSSLRAQQHPNDAGYQVIAQAIAALVPD